MSNAAEVEVGPLLVKGHDGEGGVLAKVEKENDKCD